MPLPSTERLDRLHKLTESLPGASIEGETMPSDTLIGKYHTMAETGDLRAVPWNELIRRDVEVRNGGKKEDFFK